MANDKVEGKWKTPAGGDWTSGALELIWRKQTKEKMESDWGQDRGLNASFDSADVKAELTTTKGS